MAIPNPTTPLLRYALMVVDGNGTQLTGGYVAVEDHRSGGVCRPAGGAGREALHGAEVEEPGHQGGTGFTHQAGVDFGDKISRMKRGKREKQHFLLKVLAIYTLSVYFKGSVI